MASTVLRFDFFWINTMTLPSKVRKRHSESQIEGIARIDIRECLLRCCSRPPTFRSKGISICCCDFVSLSSWFPWFPCLPMRVTVTIISFTCFSLHSPLLWLFKPFKLASCFISTTSFYLLTDADSADRNIQSEEIQTMQRYIRYHQIYIDIFQNSSLLPCSEEFGNWHPSDVVPREPHNSFCWLGTNISTESAPDLWVQDLWYDTGWVTDAGTAKF